MKINYIKEFTFFYFRSIFVVYYDSYIDMGRGFLDSLFSHIQYTLPHLDISLYLYLSHFLNIILNKTKQITHVA